MRKQYPKYRFTIVFFLTVSIFNLLITNASTIQTESEVIKKLEEREKAVLPEVITRPNVEYRAGDLNDPFQSPNIEEVGAGKVEVPKGREAQLPSLTVQGISWGGSFPQAIINNKVVKTGDIIEGAQVISIDKNGVVVLFQDEQYNLSSPAAGTTSYQKP